MNHSIQSSARRNPVLALLLRALEIVLIIAMAALVLDVLWGVFSRMFTRWGWLEGQSSWTEELARYLMIWVGLLGACLAFEKHAHLGVDYFVGKLHPAAGKLLKLAALAIVLFFAAFVLMWGGWQLVSQTSALGQMTPTLGIPKAWVYVAVPLSGVFTALFTLAQMVDTVRAPSDATPVEEESV
jgi:TRAP-type C4-dicarboxylate transport system permease small subunit